MKQELIDNLIVFILPVLCGVAVPFVRVVRGGSPLKAFFMGWACLVVSFLFFTVIVPLVFYHFDRDFGRAVSSLFPEPPIVVAMVFLGWFYAGIPILVGIAINLLGKMWQTRRKA